MPSPGACGPAATLIEEDSQVDSEIERLRKKAENYPSPSVYSRLADLLHRNGALDDADLICRRCIKEFPRKGDVYVVRARIQLARQQRADAVATLEECIKRDTQNGAALELLADIAQEDGDLPRAIAHLERLRAVRGDDQALLDRLRQLQERRATRADEGVPARHDTETVDLTNFSSGLTSFLSAMGNNSVPPPPSAKPASGNLLQPLCQEAGVTGAVVFDTRGHPLISSGLDTEQETLLAAMAQDVSSAADAALHDVSGGRFASWLIQSHLGQLMAFRRNEGNLCLVALTEQNVKAALMELKARQALIDLGEA